MSDRISALAIDIDGTLINSDKVISRFTRSEIERVVRDFGVRLFLVTARGPQATAVIESRLGVPASFATYGGSVVWARDEEGFTVLRERPIDSAIVDEVVRASRGSRANVGVYTRETWYVSALDYWALREARNTAIWPEVASLTSETVGSLGPVFKIMFREEPEVLAPLAQKLDHLADDVFVHFSGRAIEVINADAVKLSAVEVLSEHFGFGPDQVMAFGDTIADVGMLDGVGVGVLMANAKSDLVVSDRVQRTLSNDEDGIGVMLRKYFPTDAPFDP